MNANKAFVALFKLGEKPMNDVTQAFQHWLNEEGQAAKRLNPTLET